MQMTRTVTVYAIEEDLDHLTQLANQIQTLHQEDVHAMKIKSSRSTIGFIIGVSDTLLARSNSEGEEDLPLLR
jgi:hypothetical protein